MKLNSKIIGIILIVVLFGGIGITKALDLWHTETTKEPAKIKSGEFAGENDPADIRGSYTFGDINDSFDIPVEDLAKAFGINNIENIESFSVKELENIYANLGENIEIGTASVRYFTALYLNLPYKIDEEVYLPEPAVNMLKMQNKINEEMDIYLSTHTVDISNIKAENNSAEHILDDAEEKKVKGNTTFKEVLDWGVTEEAIQSIINEKLPNVVMTIKDYCAEKEIEFSIVKTAIQEKIDELK